MSISRVVSILALAFAGAGALLVGQDGGWSESALVTGASLYALRILGLNDGDPAIARGTRWLLEHQGADGGWSHGGAARGEAIWGQHRGRSRRREGQCGADRSKYGPGQLPLSKGAGRRFITFVRADPVIRADDEKVTATPAAPAASAAVKMKAL
jgi:hypothetical protein